MVRNVEVEDKEPEERLQQQTSTVELDQLAEPQKTELQQLLTMFPALFCYRPGQTNLLQHTIQLTDTTLSTMTIQSARTTACSLERRVYDDTIAGSD